MLHLVSELKTTFELSVSCRSLDLSVAGEPIPTPYLLYSSRLAPFTPLPATQPDLTAFARALCVRRVDSRHRERHVAAWTAALAVMARSKAPFFYGWPELGQKSRRGDVDRPCTAACTVVATARLPLVAYGCIWDRFASPAQSARANVRHVLRFARCDDRDARTAKLGRHVESEDGLCVC